MLKQCAQVCGKSDLKTLEGGVFPFNLKKIKMKKRSFKSINFKIIILCLVVI